MARKPILSGPVLNREDVQSRLAGNDVMSRIIENDRERNGRAAPTRTTTEGQKLTKLQEIKKDSNTARKEESSQEINQPVLQESPAVASVGTPENHEAGGQGADAASTASHVESTPTPPSPLGREVRLAKILEMAESDEMIVVSVRVPRRLNEYLDQYVSRAPRKASRQRYLKQDAMTEALAAFAVDHPMPKPEDLY